MLHEVKLETLKEAAAGTVDAAFATHIKRVAEDCYDRPGCKNPRQVTLLVKVTPVIDQAGLCETVKMEVEISSFIPKHVSRPIDCGIRKGGKLVFNDLSEDDVHQKTVDEIE